MAEIQRRKIMTDKTEQPDSDMDLEIRHGYQFAGNYWVAIAINIKDPKDSHYFTNQTMEVDGIEQGAFTRAIGWAYPGPPCNDEESLCPYD